DHRVVSGHDLGDILDRLTGVETDLLAADVHGMSAELGDGDLGRVPRAVRRLLEDQGHTLGDAGGRQRAAEIGRWYLGEGQDLADLVRREVGDVEAGADGHRAASVGRWVGAVGQFAT